MKKVFVLNSEYFGHGDNKLGNQLMGAFLKKVWGKDEKPDAIIFYNSAVKLLARGSDYLDALTGLEEAGVELLACGTCINSYELKEHMEVGLISGMQEIVEIMMEAESVITI
ncbi:MAG: sulfurtransferase-like selenium metabolism protein YedF [Clostridiales bacterium]|nr:sulfurtransferase-like selenium metabolism protein YedF [Clostridiales bacterium]